jgi:glycosyltransferase involved in cell wall biosynthesis
VEVIGKRWRIDPSSFARLTAFIRQVKPDLVHTWLFAANAYGRAAALRARVPHLAANERCVDPWKRWHELALDRFLARRTDRIVVNSTGVRDFYVSHGLQADRFVVIQSGVDPPPPPSITKAELLGQLNLPPDSRLIAAVCRLWPQKRVKDLIWAADLLKVIRHDTHLVIMGDGPHRRRLERYREQVRIEDRVHFLGHRADARALLPHFDCLWLASEYEGLPNCIMEAMQASLPVVATDIPGNADLVVPGETGYLVPLGDRAGFARATHRLLDDPALARKLGEAGKQRIDQHFTLSRMVDRYAAMYREVLG